jgi:hypothetical protein
MDLGEGEARTFKQVVLALLIFFGAILVYQAIKRTGGCAPLGNLLSYGTRGIGWGGAGGTGGLMPRAGGGDAQSAGSFGYEGGQVQQGYPAGGVQGYGWRTGSGG